MRFYPVFDADYHFFNAYYHSDKDDISEELAICHGSGRHTRCRRRFRALLWFERRCVAS